jgi:PKD repeat protein
MFAWDLNNDGLYDNAVGATPSASWPDNGVYTIGLLVTDSAGLTNTATTTVTIANVNPQITSIDRNTPVRRGEPVTVQTHAWVEAALPGNGWVAIDPTNPAPVGERHVVIGRGRDYDDVTPLRGVYSGRSEASLAVEVTMVAGTLGPRSLPVVELVEGEERAVDQ